jgi:DNA topoisomerase-1
MNNLLSFNKLILFGGSAEKKWNTLNHNGIFFPEEYIQHFIPLIYDKKKIILNKEAEEYASLYVKYLDSDYIKNKNFNKNFWNDWKDLLHDKSIKNLDNCDFKLIKNYINEKKEIDKNNVKDNSIFENYKYAIVDGKQVKISNFKIEPPGLFIGRGNHPKIGKIKKRIFPEDIIINIGKNEIIPISIKGHMWKNVINDNTKEWIAAWKDDISGKIKYVWLGDKSKSDIKKYDLARKLKKKINDVRK